MPTCASPRAKSRAQRRDALQAAHTRARSRRVMGVACLTNSGSMPNSLRRSGSNSDGPLWLHERRTRSLPFSPTSEAMRLSSPGGQAANSLIARRLLKARRQLWRKRLRRFDACSTIICSSQLAAELLAQIAEKRFRWRKSPRNGMLPHADICRLTWIKANCGQLCMDQSLGAHHLMIPRPKACSVCAVRETALCRVLDTQQLARLNRSSYRRWYPAGQLIAGVTAGRGLVRDGAVRCHQAF